MHRPRLTRFTLILPVLSALAVAGGGIALANDSPRTTPAAATFTGKVVSNHAISCTGADGKYVQQHTSFAGTFVSSNAQLNGPFTAVTNSLTSLTTGNGTEIGNLVIRDAKTGKAKAEAQIFGVTKGNDEYGMLVGHVEKVGAAEEGRLLANFTAKATGATTFAGQLGGMDNTSKPGSEPAVIQSGHCSADND